MPRIRSIKPEFWTSEVVASWHPETRLTFIGLWTLADDNGVGLANERLITAQLFPMDDLTEASVRTHRALTECANSGAVVMYEASGRRLYYLTSWDEHQKINRPSSPRFPRPSGPSTRTNGLRNETAVSPHEGLTESAVSPHSLARAPRSREQGAGSREGERASDELTHETTAPPAESHPRFSNPSMDPLQARCDRHAGVEDPPNCHACGQGRRVAEQAAEEHRRTQAAATSTAARERAALRRAEIDECAICDSDGYRFGQVCDHDPTKDERTRRGRALVAAALAGRRTTEPPTPAPSVDPERKAAARSELDAARRTTEPEAEPS